MKKDPLEKQKVVIGTRGSALARWQAAHVGAALVRHHPGLVVEEKIIVTEGDRFQSGPLVEIGGKGVWVKEIEAGLLAGEIDLAVHSLKDVPAALAPGLVLAAIPERADPRDALVSREGLPVAALPRGARIGTSSLRRVCQLKAWRPDLVVEVLRGNVDTRLRKIEGGVVDAGVLACAGLDRLGFGGRITERLDEEQMLPAIGQGALAIETRAADEATQTLVRALKDEAAEITVAAERALLARLGGGCRTPIAGHARVRDGRVELRALVGRPDGSEILREGGDALARDAAALGAEIAERLLARGAARILAELES